MVGGVAEWSSSGWLSGLRQLALSVAVAALRSGTLGAMCAASCTGRVLEDLPAGAGTATAARWGRCRGRALVLIQIGLALILRWSGQVSPGRTSRVS